MDREEIERQLFVAYAVNNVEQIAALNQQLLSVETPAKSKSGFPTMKEMFDAAETPEEKQVKIDKQIRLDAIQEMLREQNL